ncbi:amidase [Castellaniella sp.]|uniref:amidase n=1 Tax=Castellaniella sp. TaxID=1955812 RepID=UPI003562E548
MQGFIESHVTRCLDRADARPQERDLAFTYLDGEAAIRAARAMDGRREDRADGAILPLAGRVCSVKACFDVRGWVTHAGSRALAGRSPAMQDAAMVAALRQAGAVLLGQTNMTEFAFGALGLNTFYGTPLTPLVTGEDRVSGGSSSGAAVSVALGFADFALCTDTSGSARIPAGFCGVAGYIPSQGAWPCSGMLNLAPSFDTPGIMAASARQCLDIVEAVGLDHLDCQTCLHGQPASAAAPFRVLVPDEIMAPQPEADVLAVFHEAVRHLRLSGIEIIHGACAPVRELGELAGKGDMFAAEAFTVHQHYLRRFGDRYDPLIRARIESGRSVPAHEYLHTRWLLDRLARDFDRALTGFDALLTPTSPILPPRLVDLHDETTYLAQNRKSFAYTEIASRFGLPSLSLPGWTSGEPVGILFTGRRGRGRALLQMASTLESLLQGECE